MNEKKRYDIIFFPDSLKRGGAERVTVRLSEYFVSKGLRVAIVTTNPPYKMEYGVPEGVDRISVGIESKNLFKLIIGYSRILRTIEVGVAILMGLPHGCYIVPACLINRVKLIISERNSPANFDGKKITRILMNYFMKFGNGYVFQTEQAKKYYSSIIKKPSTVIKNPIDASELPNRASENNAYQIISVGRLARQKNQTMMIKAFANVSKEFPEATLTIYGDGELRKELKNLVRRLQMERKIFLPGVVENVLEIEAQSGLFLFSSNFEGIPNALLEAMAIGIPCISTDCPCGGPASVIIDGYNGKLVPVGDERAMAASIRYMLRNPNEARKMGEEAKKIREELELGRIGNQWLYFINSIKSE